MGRQRDRNVIPHGGPLMPRPYGTGGAGGVLPTAGGGASRRLHAASLWYRGGGS